MLWLVVVSCIILLPLVGLYIYTRLTVGMCVNNNSLEGKTILITGGNSGIGFEAAKEFAKRGARLLMACRNQAKARTAIANIIQETKNEDIILYKLDTSSLQSVEDLVEDLKHSRDIKIHVLCLNAGSLPDYKRQESVDGFELCFATNHLGHFHLANLVKPLLAPSARIIITSSVTHKLVQLDFSDLQQLKHYDRINSYSGSKLMNIYHMRELSARLKEDGILVNALHPGIVRTSFVSGTGLIEFILSRLIIPIYGKTPWEGAQTLIKLATCDKLEEVSGLYFEDCRPRRLSPHASDNNASKQLWDYCENLIAQWKNKRHATN